MIEPHRIASQLFNRPLLLTPASARTISSFVLSRFDARRGSGGDDDSGGSTQAFRPTVNADGSAEFHAPRASRFVGEYRTGPDGRPSPYRVTPDGTAVISIIGELVNRGAWIGASSGLVSYEGIAHQVRTAARDPQVTAILLDLETPGGEAVGTFEIAALIREAREIKPVIAVVNGMAASAGYAIASAASRVVTTPTGISGSIGVVWLHLDISGHLANAGVTPTFIFAGARKVDGNEFAPLSPDAAAAISTQVDAFYSLFIQTVAAGRPRLSEAAIRATEAGIYLGADALRAGLVDAVGSFDAVVEALASPASRASLIGSGLPTRQATAGLAIAPAAQPAALPQPSSQIEPDDDPVPALAPVQRSREERIRSAAAHAATLGIYVDVADALAHADPDTLSAALFSAAVAKAEGRAVPAVQVQPPVKRGSLVDAAKRQAARTVH